MIDSSITPQRCDKEALCDLVREMKRIHGRCRVIEVGSWYGETATVLSEAGADEVYCVDHWKGSDDPHDELAVQHKKFPRSEVWKTWCLNTMDYGNIFAITASSLMASQMPWAVEMVFLDADHSYEAVKADIREWSKRIVPGGILCGHDFNMFMGVRKAVEESGPYETKTNEIWMRRIS